MKSEKRLRSVEKIGDDPAISHKDSPRALKVTDILDVTAKLIGAFAILGATYVANLYQSSMAASNLLSQREQADSSLRASMFRDLIGPIVGSEKNNGNIPVNRERLLVELLALNFYEHFELKPIMLHVDRRLADEKIKDMDQSQKERSRESLRSIARRVVQRQLAVLTKAEIGLRPEAYARIDRFDMKERPRESEQIPAVQSSERPVKYFDDLISMKSSNGIYTLLFTIYRPDTWKDQTFRVAMRIQTDDKPKEVYADQDFLLTWFDFPFTDNTLLADGTRFSLAIDKVDPDEKTATIQLVWFPQDYFSARERPTNYRELREKLGLALRK
jgi:hypothetical protein